MKKGIILEKRDKYMIVITADGAFEKAIVFNEKAMIGDEVMYKPYAPKLVSLGFKTFKGRLFSAAFGLILFMVPFYYLFDQNHTYAYVTVDINPSIELQVSESLDVHHITALNTDAEEIVKKFKGTDDMTLEAVLSQIMESCEEKALVSEGKQILIGVSYEEQPVEEITGNIKQYFKTTANDWQMVTFQVPHEVREQAVKNNTSMNKEFAALLLAEDQSVLEVINLNDEKKNMIHAFYQTKSNNEG